MLDYALVKCNRCDLPSVGTFSTPNGDGWDKKFYCNKHWYARSTIEDREQDQREYEQFKDKKWYQEAFPQKFTTMEDSLEAMYNRKKAAQRQQVSLF